MDASYENLQEIAADMRDQVQYLLSTKKADGQPQSRFERGIEIYPIGQLAQVEQALEPVE